MGKISIERSFGAASKTQQIHVLDSDPRVREDTPGSPSCESKARVHQETRQPSVKISVEAYATVTAVQHEFSLQPRQTPDWKLPFIPADEVAKRNGKGDADLCVSHRP